MFVINHPGRPFEGPSCSSALGYELGYVKSGRIREYNDIAAMGTFTGRIWAEDQAVYKHVQLLKVLQLGLGPQMPAEEGDAPCLLPCLS